MPFEIIRNDITKMDVDAIVNAANSELLIGGGVCGAIFKAAGASMLQDACNAIGECKVGSSVITKGFNLSAKYVIHTVGPVWVDGKHNESKLLKNCYTNSLKLALENNIESIAFPLISSGIYGYPKVQAFEIAISIIGEFILKHDMMVYLVVYDQAAVALSEKLSNSIEKYIDDNYVEENLDRIYSNDRAVSKYYKSSFEEASLTDEVNNMDESFTEMLLRLIDEKGMTDVETYKRANIDRRLFSKIRSNSGYNPSKGTAIAFSIALELNLDETMEFLSKAGYALSKSYKFDIIIMYFIEKNNFDIFKINEALFMFNQVLLGAQSSL